MQKIELSSPRLSIAAPTLADVDAIVAACQDPEIQRRIPVPVPYTLADAESFVSMQSDSGWADGTRCTWAIRLAGDPAATLAGVVSLHDISAGLAMIGYWLAPQHRGQGLLGEATRAVIDFGFAATPTGLGLARIEWHANGGNTGSAHVARRAGFRFEGTRRLGAIGRQGREDDWVAGLLADDDRTPRPWPILA